MNPLQFEIYKNVELPPGGLSWKLKSGSFF